MRLRIVRVGSADPGECAHGKRQTGAQVPHAHAGTTAAGRATQTMARMEKLAIVAEV